MAVTSRGDAPLRSAWITRRPLVGGGALLRTTPFASADREAIFADWLFESSGGVDALNATGVSSGTPSVGTPALTQRHSLSTSSIQSGTPSVGAPSLTQVHALSSSSIASGTPSVGTSSLTQLHALSTSSVSSGTPSVGLPAITQAHALSASGVSTSSPSVGSPVLSETHTLSAVGVSSGAPSVGSPTLSVSVVVPYPESVTIRIANRARFVAGETRNGGFRIQDREGVYSLANRSADIYLQSRYVVIGVEL